MILYCYRVASWDLKTGILTSKYRILIHTLCTVSKHQRQIDTITSSFVATSLACFVSVLHCSQLTYCQDTGTREGWSMSVLCPDGTEKWEAAHSSQRLPSCLLILLPCFLLLFACSSQPTWEKFPKDLISMATVHLYNYSAGIFCPRNLLILARLTPFIFGSVLWKKDKNNKTSCDMGSLGLSSQWPWKNSKEAFHFFLSSLL